MNNIIHTAYHEAGHAVVDFDHDNFAGNVTVISNPELGSAGSSQSEEWDSGLGENHTETDALAAIQAKIVALYAGLEAERLVDPSTDPAVAQSDYEEAEGLACLAGLDLDDLARLRQQAEEHVLRRREAIGRLARVLVDLRTLDQDQVECAIEDAPFRTRGLRSSLYTAHLSDEGQRRHEQRATLPTRFHIPPFDPSTEPL